MLFSQFDQEKFLVLLPEAEKAFGQSILNLTKIILPSLVIMASFLVTYLGIALYSKWTRHKILSKNTQISRLRLPEIIVWLMILSWILLLLNYRLAIFAMLYQIALNLMILTTFLFLVQGLAIIIFYLKKIKTRPGMQIAFFTFIVCDCLDF